MSDWNDALEAAAKAMEARAERMLRVIDRMAPGDMRKRTEDRYVECMGNAYDTRDLKRPEEQPPLPEPAPVIRLANGSEIQGGPVTDPIRGAAPEEPPKCGKPCTPAGDLRCVLSPSHYGESPCSDREPAPPPTPAPPRVPWPKCGTCGGSLTFTSDTMFGYGRRTVSCDKGCPQPPAVAAWEQATPDPDMLCPWCLTPWKCNGCDPHKTCGCRVCPDPRQPPESDPSPLRRNCIPEGHENPRPGETLPPPPVPRAFTVDPEDYDAEGRHRTAPCPHHPKQCDGKDRACCCADEHRAGDPTGAAPPNFTQPTVREISAPAAAAVSPESNKEHCAIRLAGGKCDHQHVGDFSRDGDMRVREPRLQTALRDMERQRDAADFALGRAMAERDEAEAERDSYKDQLEAALIRAIDAEGKQDVLEAERDEALKSAQRAASAYNTLAVKAARLGRKVADQRTANKRLDRAHRLLLQAHGNCRHLGQYGAAMADLAERAQRELAALRSTLDQPPPLPGKESKS